MLHRKKTQIKVVFVDTLEYQGTLDTMVHLAETAEMDLKETKVTKVRFKLDSSISIPFSNIS